jgi:hypothetical protein
MYTIVLVVEIIGAVAVGVGAVLVPPLPHPTPARTTLIQRAKTVHRDPRIGHLSPD